MSYTADLCTGGTPISNNVTTGTEGLDKVFDSNFTTKYYDSVTAGGTWTFQVQLGTAATVTNYKVTNGNYQNARDPVSWVVQGSNDGSTWTNLDSRTGISFGGVQTHTNGPYTIASPASYLYYRFVTLTNGGSSNMSIGEIEGFNAGGTNVFLSQTYTALCAMSTGSETVAAAFDNNYGTNATTQGTDPGGFKWFGYQFASAQAISQYTVTSGDYSANRDLTDFTFQYSDDGSSWTTADTRTAQTWSGRQIKNTYQFTPVGAHVYWRIRVTKSGDGTNNPPNDIECTELEMMALIVPSGVSFVPMKLPRAMGPLAYPGGAAGFDQSHFAAQNARVSVVATVGGAFTELVSGRAGTISGSPTTSIDGRIGRVFRSGGSGDATAYAGMPADAYAVTMAFIAIFDGSQDQGVVFNTNADPNGGGVLVAADGTLYAHFASNLWNVNGFKVPLNVPVFIGYTQTGGHYWFVVKRLDNGQVWTPFYSSDAQGYPSAAYNMGTGGNGTYTIGKFYYSNQSVKAGLAAAMISGCLLTPPQLLQWSTDPWAYWYPRKTTLMPMGAAATSSTAALLGFMLMKFTGRALSAGRAGLSGNSRASLTTKASPTYAMLLAGRSAMAVKAMANWSGKAALAGQTWFETASRAGFTGKTSLTGQSAFQIRARGASTGFLLLAGRSAYAVKALAAWSGKAALAGQTWFETSTRAGWSGKTALSGQTAFKITTKSASTGFLLLAGRTIAQIKALSTSSGKAGLSAASAMSVKTKAAISGVTGLSARTAISLKSSTAVNMLVALTARTSAQIKSASTATLALAMSARNTIQVKSAAAMNMSVVLAGRASMQIKSSASATGKTALAGFTRLTIMASLVPPGAIALFGRTIVRLTAAAMPKGTAPLQGQAKMGLVTRGGYTVVATLGAITRFSTASRAAFTATANLGGATKLKVASLAGSTLGVALSGLGRISTTARSAITGKASLAGRTLLKVTSQGMAGGIIPLLAVTGRTVFRLVARGVLQIVGKSSRFASGSFENRSAKVPPQDRSAQAPPNT